MPLSTHEIQAIAQEHHLSAEEVHVLTLLHETTYDHTVAETGWSKHRIWQLARTVEARKHESQIQRRRSLQREYFREILGQTVRSDVLDFLRALPDKSAQLILTSPPYNQGKPYEGSSDARHPLDYLGWMLQILAEMTRILDDNGVLFFQVGSTRDYLGNLVPIDTLLYQYYPQLGLTPQNRVVWTRPHGLIPKNKLAHRHETALVWSKGDVVTFNPFAVATPQKQPGKRNTRGEISSFPLGSWPTDVWDIPNIGHNHPEKTGHPCQMPLGVAMKATLLYTLPGQSIVDPFSGSGTTEEACIRTHREFRGADLDYGHLRQSRLASAVPDTQSPLPGLSDEAVALWQAEARGKHVPAQPTSQAEQQSLLDLFFQDEEDRDAA